MKATTTVLIDENLRDLAKARGLSMSNLLERAISLHCDIPTNKEDIDKKRAELKTELVALDAEVARLAVTKQLISKKDALQAFDDDVAYLHETWVKSLKGETKLTAFTVVLNKFIEKNNMVRALAMQYAEGRKGI